MLPVESWEIILPRPLKTDYLPGPSSAHRDLEGELFPALPVHCHRSKARVNAQGTAPFWCAPVSQLGMEN